MNKEDNDILNGNTDDSFDKMIEFTSKLKVPVSNQGKEAAWGKLMQSIEQNSNVDVQIVRLSSQRKLWYGIAATILVLITVATLTYNYSVVEFQMLKGGIANRVLPDSSEVMLNADSRIEYRRYGWLANREIKLNGEAFFSVKKGSRFTVITEFNRRVIVTGTRFNVFARGDQFEVKCFEGSVVVEIPTVRNIALTQGKAIRYNNVKEIPAQFVLDSIAEPTWTKGEFYFNDTPLNLVFDELSRQFNVAINTNGVDPEKRVYTGFFTRSSIAQALDLVCIPMGLTHQISSDSTSVIIRK